MGYSNTSTLSAEDSPNMTANQSYDLVLHSEVHTPLGLYFSVPVNLGAMPIHASYSYVTDAGVLLTNYTPHTPLISGTVGIGLGYRAFSQEWFSPYAEAGYVGGFAGLNYKGSAVGGKHEDIVLITGTYVELGIGLGGPSWKVSVGVRQNEIHTRPFETLAGQKFHLRSRGIFLGLSQLY